MHPSEAKVLKLLKDKGEAKASELAKGLGMKPSAVGRLAYSLSRKGLVETEKLEEKRLKLTEEGREVQEKGLPEKRLLKKLPMPLIAARKKKIAFGWILKRKWAEVEGGKLVPVVGEPPQTEEERLLENFDQLKTDDKRVTLLRKRKWVETDKSVDYHIKITDKGKETKAKGHITQITPELLKGGKWENKKFVPFSPDTPVPAQYAGRIHPLTETIETVRRTFLEMGFREVSGEHATSAFWCFDALFVPQDHPAREMQDTFYLTGESELPGMWKDVARMHRRHWGSWHKEEAQRRLLRTHTTAVSAQELAAAELPVKIFTVGRNFRNETVDYKHTAEFFQVEGIVFQEKASFNNLVGYLKEFFRKLGVPKIRIRPGYFPYTEFSTEVDIWFEPQETWMELGGAGIFRPEVVKPLTGRDEPVLAWGLGLERVVMLRYGIDDIRDIYRSDLQKLREREVFW